ncbi:hypothetical protein AB595_11000 [Massilia sp. WF1]|uniref:hypothetical protein n=1 Tax=Massilia sp. WF1 TaxID=1406431 RepID=UPI000649E4BA|nr:hypothetical protein [Massilia sp. WF1]KLU36361.1 hypothetical protein AB595_11000 [Massilia sp. WF1]
MIDAPNSRILLSTFIHRADDFKATTWWSAGSGAPRPGSRLRLLDALAIALGREGICSRIGRQALRWRWSLIAQAIRRRGINAAA